MPIEPNDLFARHVCLVNKKNYCRISDNTVKPKAFKPNRQGQTSVFLVTDLQGQEVCTIGQEHVCKEKPIYGYAVLKAQYILAELQIDLDAEPEGHANIGGWPNLEEKEKIQDIAQVLAARAQCIAC